MTHCSGFLPALAGFDRHFRRASWRAFGAPVDWAVAKTNRQLMPTLKFNSGKWPSANGLWNVLEWFTLW